MIPSNYLHYDSSGGKSSAYFNQQMDHNTDFLLQSEGFVAENLSIFM